jgi:NADH:ubiquinone oxidoreductase subunit C
MDLFRAHSLSELTAINYPEYFFNFELIYIFLSYKLNLRFLFKLSIVKESLVLSLSNFFFNAD